MFPILLILNACDPTSMAISAGASTGVAAYQERGIKGFAHDTAIEAQIYSLWLKSNKSLMKKIGVEVYENRVLLTGIVQSEKDRALAIGLVWSIDGVKDVINEIIIGKELTMSEIALDAATTAELKSRLTFQEQILAVNFAIETVRGTIYLIGIAQNKKELDHVINQARDLSYVKKIISHVRIKNSTTKTKKRKNNETLFRDSPPIKYTRKS